MSTIPDGNWPPSLERQYAQIKIIQQERLSGAETVLKMQKDYICCNIDEIVHSV